MGRGHPITAEVEIPEGVVANGTVIVQGGRFGGLSLHVKDGIPAHDYNFLGLARYSVCSSEPLKPGTNTIRFEFAYDGIGKGGMGTLFINDEKVGEGRIDRTQPLLFSADEPPMSAST